MTSQELVDRITGYRWFRDRKIQIDEGEVLVAANTAQDDILADLHPFDDLGYLATVSGQEQYTFTRGTVTGATNLSPITISETAHKYHTGDRVTIAGCVGNTAANGTFIVTYVGANSYSLNGSTGNGAWTSGGYSYHCLIGAERLASDLMDTVSFKRVVPRRYEQLQGIRGLMIAGNPQWVYQLTKPNSGLTLGFHGIPDAVRVFEFRYYKIPLPHERISLTVDPWVEEEQLMFYGTLFYTLDMLKSSSDEVVERKAAMLYQQYEQVKEGEKILQAKKKYVNDINAGLRF